MAVELFSESFYHQKMDMFEYQVAVRAEHRDIAGGNLSISVPVQGCWRIREWGLSVAELSDHLSFMIDELDLTSFDHADIYGDYECEGLFGEALKRTSHNRHHIQLIGKCGIRAVSTKFPEHRLDHYDTGKSHIIDSVTRSLQQLGTEYLDLLLIHRPDPLMRVEELAEAFSILHHRGMVRHFGVSNFSSRQWKNLAAVSPFPLVCNQIECSLLHMQPLLDGTWDELLGDGLLPLVWSPLAGGRLVDGYQNMNSALLPLLAQIGDQLDLSLAGVALAWLAALPGHPVAVLGTGDRAHLIQGIRSLQQKIDRQDWYALWEAAAGQTLP